MQSAGGARPTGGESRKRDETICDSWRTGAALKCSARAQRVPSVATTCNWGARNREERAMASCGAAARHIGHRTGRRCELQQGIEHVTLGSPRPIWQLAVAGTWPTARAARSQIAKMGRRIFIVSICIQYKAEGPSSQYPK